jgi:hypothetical protein
MANQETEILTSYESTLTAEMDSTTTVATVAAIGTITGSYAGTNPFYLVIEPDSNTQREVVMFTGVSGLQFTGASRYQDGSAAASGLTHPVGSVVRAVAVGQMWHDVHDRVDALDHGADLAGLADDDHTQYLTVARHDSDDHSGLAVDSTHLAGLGAWTDYSGSAAWTMSGSGTITDTVNYAKYCRLGNLVIYQAFHTVSSISSPVGNCLFSLPVTAAATSFRTLGSASIYDANATDVWVGAVLLESTTTVSVRITSTLNSGYFSATNPIATLAANDSVGYTVIYEAA